MFGSSSVIGCAVHFPAVEVVAIVTLLNDAAGTPFPPYENEMEAGVANDVPSGSMS
jgi:hypothetical protein